MPITVNIPQDIINENKFVSARTAERCTGRFFYAECIHNEDGELTVISENWPVGGSIFFEYMYCYFQLKRTSLYDTGAAAVSPFASTEVNTETIKYENFYRLAVLFTQASRRVPQAEFLSRFKLNRAMIIRDKAPKLPYYNINGSTGRIDKRYAGKTESSDGEIVSLVGRIGIDWNNGNKENDIAPGVDVNLTLVNGDGEPEGVLSVGASSRSGRSMIGSLLADPDLSAPYVFSPAKMDGGKYMFFTGRDDGGQQRSEQLFPWDEQKGDMGANVAMPLAYAYSVENGKRKLDRGLQVGWLLDLLAERFGLGRWAGNTVQMVALGRVQDFLKADYVPARFTDADFTLGNRNAFAVALSDYAHRFGYLDLPDDLAGIVVTCMGTGLPTLANLEAFQASGKWPGDTFAAEGEARADAGAGGIEY